MCVFTARLLPPELPNLPHEAPLLLRFSAAAPLQSVSGGLGAEHFDGVMMQLLLADGWRVRHLHDACPFNHAPSLQSCAWGGGVWDDRDIVSWASAGGRCISADEAARVLARHPGVEEVAINASSDGRVEGARCCRGGGIGGMPRQPVPISGSVAGRAPCCISLTRCPAPPPPPPLWRRLPRRSAPLQALRACGASS